MEKTQAMLDLEIERTKHAADAEAAFAAVSNEQNPWRGAGKRLSELEKERGALRLKRIGEELLVNVSLYRQTSERLQQAKEAVENAERELAEVERSEIIVRYRRALEIARQNGFGHHFGCYSKWFESNRSATIGGRRHDETAGANWPEECVFNNESDRDAVRAWRAKQGALNQARQNVDNTARSLGALRAEHPELEAIDVPAKVPA